jgi:hypothetical protein
MMAWLRNRRRRAGRPRSNRAFYAWYLRQRRLARLAASVVVSVFTRSAEDGQDRITEDGLTRETES